MLRKNSINRNFIHEIINQTNINYQLNTKNEINIAENAFSDFLEDGIEGFRNNAEME